MPRRSSSVTRTINLNYFTSNKIKQLVNQGKVVEQGGYYDIDLSKLGFNKLLGAGNINLKLRVTVQEISARATEKVKLAGGDVFVQENSTDKAESASVEEKSIENNKEIQE